MAHPKISPHAAGSSDNQKPPKRSLMELAGILSEEEGEELMGVIKEGRARSRERRDRILKLMMELEDLP